MNFWDQRFSEPGFKYGTEPNAFLRDCAARLAPASQILVPGDGEGRNGVWLAGQGHGVTSVDSSAVGLGKAAELAAQRGVPLNTQLVDLADWAPAETSVDAVVLIYTHLPSAFRQRAHQALAHGLKPGGWLILEAFHPAQLAHASGGPKDVDMLYTPEQLTTDFAGLLSPVLAWHGETTLSEGPGHQGLAHVTRWLGQRLSFTSQKRKS
ncbi:class I SAM-dependent methyltransferase [Rhodoferax sp.]|uniref:SAM-dependent methyltransferase n=1 Tax=Rhodoferax sp. TaxID=50421 RepID=UPI00262177A8|nr:class I SAM-dependent methyltransferase [Rhodoferax sp.]MDD2925705.1 class I SAM-dependent methyltransferase [Rhodoferax sp.]